jgi:hypothetical protein
MGKGKDIYSGLVTHWWDELDIKFSLLLPQTRSLVSFIINLNKKLSEYIYSLIIKKWKFKNIYICVIILLNINDK